MGSSIIYIIIAIVIALINAAGKSKQKPKQASTPPPVAPPVNSAEEMFRRLQEMAQQQEQSQNRQQVEEYDDESANAYDDIEEISEEKFDEGQHYEATKDLRPTFEEGGSSIQTVNTIELEKEEDTNTLDFDIRQAVVYSAILNRPNF